MPWHLFNVKSWISAPKISPEVILAEWHICDNIVNNSTAVR
jgi:hypothetical protein